MYTFSRVDVPAARREQLGAIIADYLTLERTRQQRRSLVAWRRPIAAIVAWTIEFRCSWRLARRLDEVPRS